MAVGLSSSRELERSFSIVSVDRPVRRGGAKRLLDMFSNCV